MIKILFQKSSNIGKLTLLIGLLLLVPLVMLPFYSEDIKYIGAFLVPAFVSIILGLILCLFFKKGQDSNEWNSSMRSGSLTVLYAWGYAFLAGAMPFFLSGKLELIQSIYEAVSGWTTTGLSVMDVTEVPKIFLFHRSFMQFCGGLGFILVMIIFIQGKQSMSLYNAEGHPDKLMPNLKKTAQTIFFMYISFLVGGTIAYKLCGMGLFDSINHAMCALSTGGFSTVSNSIGEYNSIAIEAVSIVLMLIGTTNFAVLLLLAKGKFKSVSKVSEIRFLFVLLAIFVPILSASLFTTVYSELGDSVRISLFNAVSALSTTGFSTVSYTDWSSFSRGIMVILMVIGGGIGSTAGGMKLTRVYLTLRITGENIRKRLNPSRYVKSASYTKAQGKSPIDSNLISDTLGFVICYFIIFVTGSMLLTLTAGCSLEDGLFEFASCLGTVGLSIGLSCPDTNVPTMVVEMCGMILGRLEIFIVIIGFSSLFTSVKNKVSRT